MADLVITGASRGIGRALALAKTAGQRLVLVARDAPALEEVAAEVRRRGGDAITVPGDLSTVAGARALGDRLAQTVTAGSTLVHNAGLWPAKRVLNADGLETAFVVNHLGPWAMQAPLLPKLRRILVVSAGLIVKGRFDPERTPTGADFSSIRTYCNTKLAFAVAMRDFAAAHPELDVVVLHPGVVQTDLGARGGVLGWVMKRLKRLWETPEACAARLAKLLDRERWSPPGQPRWLIEDREQPWPAVTDDPRTQQAVREATARLL